ncbi:hypothetical protein AYO47_00575 [Planctomyces sp. SCGC AG-212-M04]|nr:hypothetical protein AYO47_00575 [Planctomyces sp. SCGC AG-212-M04]
MPRVGCSCADGTSLPYCVAATISVLSGHREAKSCCCKNCDRRDDPKSIAGRGTRCPVSGLPCRAVITSASPSTLVDVVDAPSPLMCDDVVLVASESRPPLQVSWSLHLRSDHCPLTALVDLGQLLRV